MNQPITAVFAAVIELAQVLSVRDIKQLPGAWIYQIDDQWTIALNGHDHAVTVSFENTSYMNVELPAFEMSIWYNGWLAGICSPFDGYIADGDGANEQTFIDAVRSRTEKERHP